MNSIPDSFLSALGKWQMGWREDHHLRIKTTKNLHKACQEIRNDLPSEAFHVPEFCYRKRFLVPNNPQNNGDFWPLFWDGVIEDKIASWTTDYNYAKFMFKKELRENTISAIFRHSPQPCLAPL